jgi:hypothetical protein
MNTKLFPTLVTVVIAVAGAVAMTSAMAVEATQWTPGAGTATREQVRSDLQGAPSGYGVVQYGEATQFVDRPSSTSRAFARADQGSATTTRVVHLGEATQFIDQPGGLSRAEVRAETLAAIRAARAQH